MGELQMTRRALLAVLASSATLASATRALAAPGLPDGLRFREFRVDVSPLLAKDEDEAAKWIAATLPDELQKTFAKYYAPGERGAGVLVARIDNVTLGSPHNGMSSIMATDTIDDIDGVALALDARGRTVGSFPLHSATGADSRMGLPYQDEIRRRRIETLALSFAQWLPGQMGL
jgi:hypothetical protein